MDKEEITTSDTLPEDGSADSPDGKETGSVAGVKDILSKVLGKEFPSDETALKFVKDNHSFSGKTRNYQPLIEKIEAKYGGQGEALKVMEQILQDQPKQEAVDTSKFAPIEEVQKLRNDIWESKNPDLVPFKELISDAAKARNISLDEAKELDFVKATIEKARAYDQIENSKSVLQTNSRLGQVTDKIAQAQKSMDEGNVDAARASATSAVLEAYGLK